ncbi:unnamed protein product [Vitrella brassicaformis CCMP3155]|uniref:3-hydroxyanthranilate 3,4-dioxygenase n=1 Tax=Vitrella brassicaformis (strain CCMP3155) TaxID=1169540 RepID=A0A0G4ERX2_VITBC|nr:unnamed protein product [Vitrella brassicaformis CCMP3155]|eukprot:CEL99983.1 unnamed protein product [Vitrella brassicaformis CCMP3155]
MEGFQPFNFWKFLEKHRDQLKPPVGNKMIYNEGEFKVMVVGGPNTRTDYHWEVGPEWFFQLQGDMCLKVARDDPTTGEMRFEDVHIREGDMYMLPPRVYHSPQRSEGSVGLVIERDRRPDEEHDRLTWFCELCKALIYQDTFHCTDLGKQLKPVIEAYYGPDAGRRTCKKCGWVEQMNCFETVSHLVFCLSVM